jgi:HTH-type transcriptional regulator/antitoxin HigA
MAAIKNSIHYERTLERVGELLAVVDNSTSQDDKNYVELEILSNLLADYEEAYMPIPSPTLPEILRLRMAEMGINQKALAELLNVSPSRISEYMNGTSEPTLKVAREMSLKLAIDPHILLGL